MSRWTSDDLNAVLRSGGKLVREYGASKAVIEKPKRKQGDLMRICDKIFSQRYQGGACEVCLSEGRVNMIATCGHHLIPRSRSRFLRYDPRNICVVCQAHHMWGSDKCAHGQSSLAIARFVDWLKRHRKADYDYCKSNEHTPSTRSWKQELEILTGRAGK